MCLGKTLKVHSRGFLLSGDIRYKQLRIMVVTILSESVIAIGLTMSFQHSFDRLHSKISRVEKDPYPTFIELLLMLSCFYYVSSHLIAIFIGLLTIF